jgi:FtsP/CotA-like multicopper oxidase with cupredoxin domain
MNRTVLGLGTLGWMVFFALLNCYGSALPDVTEETEPSTFTSSNHVLDLLVIARPKVIQLGAFQPTAWVFEMCQTAVAHEDKCPDDSRTVSPYGGIRLQLYPGDHLRMRLVNHLPPAPTDAQYAHGSDQMMNQMLADNPVNIHTHGLIVEPRKADATDPTYGDYVYVLGYPAGKMPAMVSPDEIATNKPIQYDIYIPANHPSGIYWFHPHVHGLNVNQISEGLSGLITIGSVTDYVSPPPGMSTIPTRYVVLKDMQVLSSGNVMDQENARFCSPFPVNGVSRDGFCQGWYSLGIPDDNDNRPGNFEGGVWFFTINGQVDPQIPMPDAPGELWRLLNAGASRSYDLVLQDDQTGSDLAFQVVSLNGVALAAPPGAIAAQSQVGTVRKAQLVPCPVKSSASSLQPVCATHLVLFPSSRAEIWVFPQDRSATLKTLMLYTGPRGDRWPEASLAHIVVHQGSTAQGSAAQGSAAQGSTAQGSATQGSATQGSATQGSATQGSAAQGSAARGSTAQGSAAQGSAAQGSAAQGSAAAGAALLGVKPFQKLILSPQGLLGAPVRASFAGVSSSLPLERARQLVHGASSTSPASRLNPHQLSAVATRLKEISQPAASLASPTCSALPAGHRRRIFFGIPPSQPAAFGLGYEEVDGNDNPVPGTFRDVASFDPATINICLPLGPHSTPVTEEWELLNLSAEAHNFHIHQTEFYVLAENAPAGDADTLMDNVVLPNGGRSCNGSVATWRAGKCPVQTVVVRIPFAEVGDFIYHCHIGEHQDGGMMAHIRVIASP